MTFYDLITAWVNATTICTCTWYLHGYRDQPLNISGTDTTEFADSQYGGDDQRECCVTSLKKSFIGQQLPVFPETDNTHHRVMATLL